MSDCVTQVYASFQLSDSATNQGQLLACLQDTIIAEALSESFDAEAIYGPLVSAFDYRDVFEELQENVFVLSEHARLILDDGSLHLEGVPLHNHHSELIPWVAWVLFRQFGQGEVLTFFTSTIWVDGTSGCTYEISRNGSVKTKPFYVQREED